MKLNKNARLFESNQKFLILALDTEEELFLKRI